MRWSPNAPEWPPEGFPQLGRDFAVRHPDPLGRGRPAAQQLAGKARRLVLARKRDRPPCPREPIRPRRFVTRLTDPMTPPPKGQDVRIASMAFKTSVAEAPLRAGTLKVYPLLAEWA